MSIASEISRLQQAKIGIKAAIEGKGVSVPSSAKLDEFSDYVDAIEQCGSIPLVLHPDPTIALDSGTGVVTAQHTQLWGQVTSGTTSASLQLPTHPGQTITPGTSYQVIPSYQFLTGSQIVKGDENLIAGNIKSGVSIFGVVGNYQPSPMLQSKTFTPTSSGSVIMPDTGYQGLSEVTVVGDANLVAGNIKSGTSIFGVVGTYAPALQSKTVTPTSGGYVITPDEGVYGLSRVTVNGDQNLVPSNIASGVSIFGVVGTHAGGGGGDSRNVVAEYLNGTLSYIYDSDATKIGVSNFMFNATALLSVEMTEVSQITSQQAFAGCTQLQTLSMPKLTSIWASNATATWYSAASRNFASCTKLVSVYMPLLSSAPIGLFYNCSSLAELNIDNVTRLEGYALYNVAISSLRLSLCTLVGSYALASCRNLAYVDLPSCLSLSQNAFYSCSNLAEVSMSALTHLTGNQAFRSCTKLTTLSFPNLKNLSGNSVFQGCNRLISLYLMSTTMCTLGARNALANGPFSSGGSGTIYVPASLLATYLANANWASFSARLSGI